MDEFEQGGPGGGYKIRLGNVEAAFWQNGGATGPVSIAFWKVNTTDRGEQESNEFTEHDLSALSELIELARERCNRARERPSASAARSEWIKQRAKEYARRQTKEQIPTLEEAEAFLKEITEGFSPEELITFHEQVRTERRARCGGR